MTRFNLVFFLIIFYTNYMQLEPNQQLEINGKIYIIIKFLGKGKGGYSYLAKRDDNFVVIKCIHHEPVDYYTFGNKIKTELRDYEILLNIGIRIPLLIDVDMEKEVLVKSYIDGPTIKEELDRKQDISRYLKDIKAQAHLAKSNGINIDYYPTNFVIYNGKLYYIDYECNPYDPKWDFENWGSTYWK